MRSTWETLLGADNIKIGAGRLVGGLDLHLSILPSKGHLIRIPTSPDDDSDTHSSEHTEPPASSGTPQTEPEIVVRVDEMDTDTNMPTSAAASAPAPALAAVPVTQADHE
jgi:hypothetical protein